MNTAVVSSSMIADSALLHAKELHRLLGLSLLHNNEYSPMPVLLLRAALADFLNSQSEADHESN